MSITILGQHIRLIRPERTRVPIPEKYKPGTGINKRSKTIELNEEQRSRIGKKV